MQSFFPNRDINQPNTFPQLLKWIGNKQRFANEIISLFPTTFNKYIEPFLGSGAILATLSPSEGTGSDVFPPLMEIWRTLHDNPDELKNWYTERWNYFSGNSKIEAYEKIKESYNKNPNGADLLFLSRSCYGGVVRFRKSDGYMSTPCGIHTPILPKSFSSRVDEWHYRTQGTKFLELDYEESMGQARTGDLIYCDPPYTYSQSILYRGHTFSLEHLFEIIDRCKSRGIYVALSIDGTKQSGDVKCSLPIPKDLFKRELFLNCGRSMLKRFQMNGQTLEKENVTDRLLLTY